ncbi:MULTISPECIES: hypothetical protein [unclassified Streptomyces]|uniref:hypothetical protein n=1 Tax=unclassified Streptomyces TaxID=2593676 RepID=UPI001447D5B6|nr:MULTISPECIES: hypothetical protein [unclassified Streptomyces]MBT2453293.1 hypothetical protein [Streptomyces sp. ISL-86]
MSHIQHGPQCCCCHARANALQVEEREPFRFTDIPLGQWVVGGIMTLVIVGGILFRHL